MANCSCSYEWIDCSRCLPNENYCDNESQVWFFNPRHGSVESVSYWLVPKDPTCRWMPRPKIYIPRKPTF